MSKRYWWVIRLKHYGTFLFEGTEKKAEEARVAKARWEAEPAWKYRADSEVCAKLLQQAIRGGDQ